MKSLEARVAYLEGLLQESRPEVATDHFGPTSENALGGADRPGYDTAVRGSADVTAQALQASSAVQEKSYPAPSGVRDEQPDVLSSEVALLCLSAAGREAHFFGPSSAVTFSRVVSAAMGLRKTKSAVGSSNLSVVGTREKNNPRLESRNVQCVPVRLPPVETRTALSDAYFRNIHPQYPILHRPTFRRWESECTRAASDGTLDRVDDMSLFSTLMVYSIGSLVLGQACYESAETYYSMALDRIATILDMDSLESIQAILFCAIYSVRSPVGLSLWKVSGMAIRHCIELGYHLDPERYHRSADFLTKEMAKRCFWVAYDIDRVAAFTLGRPVGIPESAIDVELPLDIDDENVSPDGITCGLRILSTDPPTLMTGVIHALKLRRLWTEMNDQLHPPRRYIKCASSSPQRDTIDGLRKKLEEWRSGAPDQLEYSASHPLSVFASRSWFQLAYNHSMLLLYRHYMVVPHGTHSSEATGYEVPTITMEFVNDVLEECFIRAREICLIYRRIYQSSSVQFTWGSVHILFLGGLTYLFCLWRSAPLRSKAKRSDIVSTCLACSTVLIIVAERWNLATSYRDMFEALSQRTINMMCGDVDDSSTASLLPFTTGVDGTNQNMASQNTTETNAEPQFHDWLTGLDEMIIPQDSEWLVQELLRGVSDTDLLPDTTNAGITEPTTDTTPPIASVDASQLIE